MTQYLVRRLIAIVPIWLLISFFAFLLASLAPGDPAEVFLRRQSDQAPTAEDIARVRAELNLDDPFPVRYVRWVANAVQGDLGDSFRTREPVLDELSSRFVVTAQLAVPALLLSLLIALPVGVLAAVRHNSLVDRLAGRVAAGGVHAQLLAGLRADHRVRRPLGGVPGGGAGRWEHLVLPALTLALGAGARAGSPGQLLDNLGEDVRRTAPLQGPAGTDRGGWRHALRNSLISVGHRGRAAVRAPAGRGRHRRDGVRLARPRQVRRWDSIYDRDYPVIQGFVLFTGTVFLLVNLVVDLLYVRLDPKVRLEGAAT